MDFLKKNVKAIIISFLGLFHFVLLAIPFINIFADVFGTKQSQPVPGYACFGETAKALKAGSFLMVSQILFLIAAIAMLLIGTYLLLQALLSNTVSLPESFGPVSANKLSTWIHIGYAGTSAITFLATVIVASTNTTNEEFLGASMSAGVSIGFGVILAVLLAVGSFVILLFMDQKNASGNFGTAQTKSHFVCSQCGEPAKKGISFCSKCGGKVVEIVPTKPICTVCGAPARKGDAFCSMCGGKVEEVVPKKPVCEACGTPAKTDASFCSLCGGKIVQK